MATATKIRCFDYVNHPYEKVCDALSQHTNEVFHLATKSAETRAENVAAGLHTKIAGVEFGKEILVNIKTYTDVETARKKQLTIDLEWKAANAPQLFPTMVAKLHVYPITTTETQLDFQGEYEPPLGILGKTIDAVIGHRIAEATVHHFLTEVADFLRNNVK